MAYLLTIVQVPKQDTVQYRAKNVHQYEHIAPSPQGGDAVSSLLAAIQMRKEKLINSDDTTLSLVVQCLTS